jgi:hypothetical protein
MLIKRSSECSNGFGAQPRFRFLGCGGGVIKKLR